MGFDSLLDAALSDARTVLVLGAGRGVYERDVRAPGRLVIGVDVDRAIRENRLVDGAVLSDGASLPFASGSFDMCIARWVVEHLHDPTAVLGEVGRVVRPGGRFVFITTNRWFYAAVVARIIPAALQRPLLKLALPKRESRDTFPAFYRANTRSTLRRLLSRGDWTEEYLRVRLGGPAYLRFSVVTHAAGVVLHWIINHVPWLEDLGHAVTGDFRRK
jgi:SAM-dependent methyltransferase